MSTTNRSNDGRGIVPPTSSLDVVHCRPRRDSRPPLRYVARPSARGIGVDEGDRLFHHRLQGSVIEVVSQSRPQRMTTASLLTTPLLTSAHDSNENGRTQQPQRTPTLTPSAALSSSTANKNANRALPQRLRRRQIKAISTQDRSANECVRRN